MSTLIIAEAGSNHDGDLDRAKKLVDIAHWAGADAVKFQLIPPFKPEWIDELIAYCNSRIEFMATPFNQTGIDALKGKVKHWKIGSPEAADPDFVNRVVYDAAQGAPIFISDGCVENKSMWDSISNLIPMACVMKYPAQPDEYHFYHSGKWGLSDHTMGILLAPLAVAHGAIAVEKHFTDDSTREGPDHPFALEPQHLQEMIQAIRLAEKVSTNRKLTIHEPERHLQWP